MTDQIKYRSSKTTTIEEHNANCLLNLTKGVDYVECALCGLIGLKISKHINEMHDLSRPKYETMYGSATSQISIRRSSDAGKINGNWIQRANDSGKDLSEYKKKMGKAVHDAIMSNSKERLRRSNLLGFLNKRQDARERSSKIAKITSARPEILKARADQLASWRAREPEIFQACLKKMMGCRTSKPEKNVLAFVQEHFSEYDFKGNQQLKASCFVLNKTKRRQIDIVSRTHKIIIEVDGFVHFRNILKWNQLEHVQRKDVELNIGAVTLGYSVIRISEDQWKPNGELTERCKLSIKDTIINISEPKLYLIGEKYKEIHD